MNMCTIWHKFTEVSESYAPLGTCSQRSLKVVHPKVEHHLTHIRRGLRKFCTTWYIFAEARKSYAPLDTYSLGSPNILGKASQSFSTNGT